MVGCAAGLRERAAAVTDADVVGQAGRVLLSSRWRDAFADPAVQVGPVQLLAEHTLVAAAGALGLPASTLLALVLELSVVAGLAALAGRLGGGGDARVAAQLLVPLAAVALGVTASAVVDGHPANALLPLAWVAAALLARDGRPLLAGALVGAAAGLEPWALLGTPVLLLGWRARTLALGLVAEAAVVALLYLPFVLGGDFAMLDYRWTVAAGAPLRWLVPAGSAFTWPMRAAQGALAVGAGTLCAWLLRGRAPAAVVAVPAAVLAARLAVDPLGRPYYLVAVQVVALLAGAQLAVTSRAAGSPGSGTTGRGWQPGRP